MLTKTFKYTKDTVSIRLSSAAFRCSVAASASADACHFTRLNSSAVTSALNRLILFPLGSLPHDHTGILTTRPYTYHIVIYLPQTAIYHTARYIPHGHILTNTAIYLPHCQILTTRPYTYHIVIYLPQTAIYYHTARYIPHGHILTSTAIYFPHCQILTTRPYT